ncbi:3-hydroxyacyl-ACP dehydratase FabZ family protein [Kaistella antarctica]|uniref:(3R)-hydroxymyristoyl-[acyl-carrier-protein] dehydratase n=1 Tax=Kaistella antarctica TaxID=266748 RepID=A0A448NPW3_9FLAO|nr:3-hydroxyacyl-ACP dehydratase FabZ family protein [Kaistella antarctica]KEY19280.1 hydroxymyristoyl-ACP dehydratase [Kaistella antarctica]SEW04968.1 3-hydroxyacyl-[acyl-carrier-protein] dehydratase [Kaistella antarctica]VEH98552.1 (3R)-hydroxymyristoyl-[acyl-carrier-protein] dehydratase [Kaistella antarctica]
MNIAEILEKLPYTTPFLFVDDLVNVDENGVTGNFTFKEDLDFYKGHFKNNPITPGVILTETMAQIGLVCLGIFLIGNDLTEKSQIGLTSTDIEFLKPVFPGEKVTVISEKIYFRFNKLKCKVKMLNEISEIVCEGTIAGIIKVN